MVPMQFLSLVLGGSTVFFGDDNGGEAVVGRRDANWACGNSAVTDVLLLSAVWVVGAVFADRIALVLGRTMQSAGGR